MKITCIDFETANAARGSVCSVGVAVIRDGDIIESCERLIRPHFSCCYFDPFNTAIHGISSSDVKDAPEFDELSPWFFNLLDTDLVIAHNAAFDIGVLRHACDLYGMKYPEFDYFCTCKAAQRFWPELWNHKLNTLCDYIGHEFVHHNAKEDAEAAAKVLLTMLNSSPYPTPALLAEHLNIKFGHLSPEGYEPCSVLAKRKKK